MPSTTDRLTMAHLRMTSTSLGKRELRCQTCGQVLARSKRYQANHSSVLLEIADDQGRWHAQASLWPSHAGALQYAARELRHVHSLATDRRTTAQVAVEAIVNSPEGFTLATMVAVYQQAMAAGVDSIYMRMLANVLDAADAGQV